VEDRVKALRVEDRVKGLLPWLLGLVYLVFLVLLWKTAIAGSSEEASALRGNVTVITAALAGLVVNPVPSAGKDQRSADHSETPTTHGDLWYVGVVLGGMTVVASAICALWAISAGAPLAFLAAVAAFATLFVDTTSLLAPKV
jgi:hypothetical protein